MEKLIREGLPGVDEEVILKVTEHLRDLGMEFLDDCQYVEEEYLSGILKPIQVKKLLSYFSKYISGSLTESRSGHEIICNVEFEEKDNLLISKSPINFPINASSMSDTDSVCLNPLPSTSSYSFSECRTKNWANVFLVPWNLFPKEAINACEKKERMRKCTYSEVVRILSENISRVDPSLGRKNLRVIAQKLIAKYPATFEDRCGDSTVADGCTTLMKKIEHCLENRKRRKGFTDLFDDSAEKLKKTPKNSYACNNWQPNKLPHGEDKASQLEHKNWLLSESRKLKRDEDKIRQLMEITYASQRYIVNTKNSVKTIKEEWPILFEKEFFLNHAKILLGKEDILHEISSNLNIKAKIIYNFMQSKPKNEAVKKCIKDILIAKESSSELDPEVIGAIILIAAYFGEEKEELFQINMDPVSSKDVEANSERLTPFIATSGGNIFTADEYLIVIDGIAALRTNEFVSSVVLWIISFFVFNIEYPEKGALTLEFIQRIFADINPQRGSKAPKGKQNVIAKQVLNLVNALRDYESHFNL